MVGNDLSNDDDDDGFRRNGRNGCPDCNVLTLSI